ncbi:MAG: hypothetical protein AAGK30_15115 [Pseudomonadota bacterium]
MDQFSAGIEGLREVRTYTFQLSALSTGMMVYSLKVYSEALDSRVWQAVFLAFIIACGCLATHFFIVAFNASHILANELLLATDNGASATVDFWGHFQRLNDSILSVPVNGGNSFMIEACLIVFVALSVATITRSVVR